MLLGTAPVKQSTVRCTWAVAPLDYCCLIIEIIPGLLWQGYTKTLRYSAVGKFVSTSVIFIQI